MRDCSLTRSSIRCARSPPVRRGNDVTTLAPQSESSSHAMRNPKSSDVKFWTRLDRIGRTLGRPQSQEGQCSCHRREVQQGMSIGSSGKEHQAPIQLHKIALEPVGPQSSLYPGTSNGRARWNTVDCANCTSLRFAVNSSSFESLAV